MTAPRQLDPLVAAPFSGPTSTQVGVSRLILFVADVFAFALAFITATVICTWLSAATPFAVSGWMSTQHAARYMAWWCMALLGLLSLLAIFQHYSERRPYWDELRDFLRLVFFLALLDMSMVALFKWNASRLWWGLAWVLAVFCLVGVRSVTRRLLTELGIWIRPAIIIGVGPNACEAALALETHPEMGWRVQGFVCAGSDDDQTTPNTHPRLSTQQVSAMVELQNIHWIIALEHAQSVQHEKWLRQLTQSGVADVSVIPPMRGVPLYGTEISHFFSHEIAMLRVRNNLRRWSARLSKRVFDTVLAVLLLLLLSPVMLLVAWKVRQDGGPALFRSVRTGKNGCTFTCYKFRSMVVDADQKLEDLLEKSPSLRAQWIQDRKLRDDPRISRFGRFLRRTSLDELPQLINVIQGHMSLVGPRPVVADELPLYAEQVGYYQMVRPGMTGLWQISGRNDLDYDTRVYLDTWYVKNWSLWYDLVILMKTVQVVLRGRGAY